jgi:hypothetical protein
MDAFSMMGRCVEDEALRFLYVLSQQGGPRGVILAVASVLAGATLAALAAWGQRRTVVEGQLGKPVRLPDPVRR